MAPRPEKANSVSPKNPGELKRSGATYFQSLSRLFDEFEQQKRGSSRRASSVDAARDDRALKRWDARYFESFGSPGASPCQSPRGESTRKAWHLSLWDTVPANWGMAWARGSEKDAAPASASTTACKKEQEKTPAGKPQKSKKQRLSTASTAEVAHKSRAASQNEEDVTQSSSRRPSSKDGKESEGSDGSNEIKGADVKNKPAFATLSEVDILKRELEAIKQKRISGEFKTPPSFATHSEVEGLKQELQDMRHDGLGAYGRPTFATHSEVEGLKQELNDIRNQPAFATNSEVERLKDEVKWLKEELLKAHAAEKSCESSSRQARSGSSSASSSSRGTSRDSCRSSRMASPGSCGTAKPAAQDYDGRSQSSSHYRDIFMTAPSAMAGTRMADGRHSPRQRTRFSEGDLHDVFVTSPADCSAGQARAARFFQQEEEATGSTPSEASAFGHPRRLPRGAEKLPKRHGSHAPKERRPSNIYMAETMQETSRHFESAPSKPQREAREARSSSPSSVYSSLKQATGNMMQRAQHAVPLLHSFSKASHREDKPASSVGSMSETPTSRPRQPSMSAQAAQALGTANAAAAAQAGKKSKSPETPESRSTGNRGGVGYVSGGASTPSSASESPRAHSQRGRQNATPRKSFFGAATRAASRVAQAASSARQAPPPLPRGDSEASPRVPPAASSKPVQSQEDVALDALDTAQTPRTAAEAAQLLGLWPLAQKSAQYGSVSVPSSALRQMYRRAAMKWHPDRPCWVSAGEESRERAAAAFRRARVAHDLLLPHASQT
eukprot:TRINITY_DN25782_c0_g1_i1.p1 TRINITY_DN25782_c0_g1~~TRINITY_DN25782_c0_g1_i1.p1  ORF type:complete len:784 (-),score=146.83 TRINITY_DN25782_c0_g1_i1:165-2516(-)